MQFVPPDFPFMNAFRFDRAMCLEYGTKLSNLVDAVERKLPKSISRFEPEYWHSAFLDVGYARRAEFTFSWLRFGRLPSLPPARYVLGMLLRATGK